MRPTPAARRALAALAACLSLAACTSSGPHESPTRTTTNDVTETVGGGTRTVAPSSGTAPDTGGTLAPLGPGGSRPRGTSERTCPYLRAGLNSDPTDGPNVADIEGNRVGRVLVLTRLDPVGCRFYFANPDYGPVAEFAPHTYPSAAAAHAALVALARTRPDVESRPGFVPGVDGVLYRSPFYGPDHGRDWAFAFAKGPVLVVIRTNQTNASLNAVQLARAIVGKF